MSEKKALCYMKSSLVNNKDMKLAKEQPLLLK